MIGKALQGYSGTRAMIDQLPWADLEEFVGPHGNAYLLFQQSLTIEGAQQVDDSFVGYARHLFRANPIIFACVVQRLSLFTEAAFKWQELNNGRPGKLFGDKTLKILEEPWAGGTTSNLLAVAELYRSIGGNFFAAFRERDRALRVMRPDWTGIILGSDRDDAVVAGDLDAEVIGYVYAQGGPGGGRDPITLLPEQVAHWYDIPDPECPQKGISWMSAIVNDARADRLATTHKERYWTNGATPNMIVKPDIEDFDEWEKWTQKFREEHEGVANRYRTLFLRMGVDAEVVGKTMSESDFVKVQSAGEVRICTVSQVPPAVVSVSEGLQGAALNAGNFEASFRQFANTWARPSWRGISGALARLVPKPKTRDGKTNEAVRLWYDDRDVPALQEDAKKTAETNTQKAQTIWTLIQAGFTKDSSVAAVEADDFSLLEDSGLTSVQLLPPGDSSSRNGDSEQAQTALRTHRELGLNP